MSRRTTRQKGVAVRRSALSVPVVVLVALLAGCAPDGGDPQKGSEELTAPTEKTEMIEETTATQAPPRDTEEAAAAADEAKNKATPRQGAGGASNIIRIDPYSPVPPDEQIESFRLDCQTLKAYQAEGQEAVDAYFWEAMSVGTTMAEVLSERGYECTDGEVRAMQRQD
jgi:hypothetical protein